MKWINPQDSWPKNEQPVWLLLEPHKERGSLLDSAMSVLIVCGVAYNHPKLNECRIENYDELGLGGIGWSFYKNDDCMHNHDNGRPIAWLPVQEMILPDFL
jgi:hypothetical protein